MGELDRLVKRIEKIEERQAITEKALTVLERAEVAGAIPHTTWANRPTTHLSVGDRQFFTDRQMAGGAIVNGVDATWDGANWVGPDGNPIV